MEKLTSSAKICLRRQRSEIQLIKALSNQRNFQYVVNPLPTPRVAFGSSLHRDTLPNSGPALSSFMRKNQPEVRPYPGPLEYYTNKKLGKPYSSKNETYVFASKMPQLKPIKISEFPPIGAYNIDARPLLKQTKKHFNGGSQYEVKHFLTPGPSTYPIHINRAKPNVCRAFGSKNVHWPAVVIICAPWNAAVCKKCGLTPNCDYWHNFFDHSDFCRICMKEKQKASKNCTLAMVQRINTLQKLNQYVKTRYCNFFHEHSGTTAAVQVMDIKTLRFKIRKENYLSLYE